MSPDSITERQIIRSVHFDLDAREEALRHSRFTRDQILHYLDGVFKDREAYRVEHVERTPTDSVYTIRKGSAVLTVETVFGRNTSYKEQPPRHFYTFTATASHRNEVLDQTDKVNDVIEWSCRIGGGLVFAAVACLLLVLVVNVISGEVLLLAFAGGAAVGGLIGRFIARRIYRAMERRLESRGEVTAVEEEWAQLQDTFGLVFDADPST